MPFFFEDPFLFLIFSTSLFALLISYMAIRFNSNALDNVGFVIAAFLMTIFYGLREPGTTDIKMYLINFDSLTNFVSFNWGFGFFVLMKSIKSISSSHEFFIFSTSFVIVLLMSFFTVITLRKQPYKTLLMVSLLYGWYMLDLVTNTYRQGIALPFIMFALYFLSQKQYLRFSVATVVAVSLHWGALIPLAICVFSVALSNRYSFVKYTSLFSVLLFFVSYFYNLRIAELIANNPLISSLQNIFIGVNISSKVTSYLNSEVDGSSFYDISILRKIKFTIEAFIPLLINTIFLFRSKTARTSFSTFESLYRTCSLYVALINIYAVSIISMAWFFRNFYWIPVASSLCMLFILSISRNSKHFNFYVALYILYIVALSILTIWTSELLKMSYPI